MNPYYSIGFILFFLSVSSVCNAFQLQKSGPSYAQEQQKQRRNIHNINAKAFSSIVTKRNLHPSQASELEAVADDLIKKGLLGKGATHEESQADVYNKHHTSSTNIDEYAIDEECEIPANGIIPPWCRKIIPFQKKP